MRVPIMPTLILTPRFRPDSQALWRAATGLGWNVERLTSWRQVPDELTQVEEPVLYAEALFAQHLGGQLGLQLKEPPDDWLPRLPYEFRKRDVVLTTLGGVRSMAFPRFIKPPNDKCFPAKVCHSVDDLPVWFPDEQIVLAAQVVAWEKEFRSFAVDGKVATASVYLREGLVQTKADYASEPEELAEATLFAEQVLGASGTTEPIVIDVGVIQDRGWAAIELNACWGSGVYGCDPEMVLMVLREEMRRSRAAGGQSDPGDPMDF